MCEATSFPTALPGQPQPIPKNEGLASPQVSALSSGQVVAPVNCFSSIWHFVKNLVVRVARAFFCLFSCDALRQLTEKQELTSSRVRNQLETAEKPAAEQAIDQQEPIREDRLPRQKEQIEDEEEAKAPTISAQSASEEPTQLSLTDLGGIPDPAPVDVIYATLNQSDFIENSCTFQALQFLEKMFQKPNRTLDGQFLGELLFEGATKYLHQDHNKGKLYDPLEVSHWFSVDAAKENEGFGLVGLITPQQEQIEFDSFVANIPRKNGVGGAVMTFRGESYAIFIRSNGQALFFNSHRVQQKQQANATVRIFASIENLAAFLAENYRADDTSSVKQENAQKLEELLQEYPILSKQGLNQHRPKAVPEATFEEYLTLAEIRATEANLSSEEKVRQENVNVVNLTPFLPRFLAKAL